MSKTVNLAVKVPEEIHQKIKIISVLSGKSMSQIIIDFVEKQKVLVPSFAEPDKATKVKKPKTTKTVKRKDQNPAADEALIKSEILRHRDKGLSLQQIADAMEADKIPTLRGGSWHKGTIGGLLKRWDANKPEDGQ